MKQANDLDVYGIYIEENNADNTVWLSYIHISKKGDINDSTHEERYNEIQVEIYKYKVYIENEFVYKGGWLGKDMEEYYLLRDTLFLVGRDSFYFMLTGW